MTNRTISIDGERFDESTDHLGLGCRSIRDMVELTKLDLLPNLRSASFSGSNLDDVGLEYVCRLATLESLDLQDTQISDSGVASLAKLPRLASLRLKENRQLTNACIPHLLRLANLVDLGIHETSIDQQGLEQLVALPSLRSVCLDVWDDNYSFDGLIAVSARMPQCRILAKGHGEFFEGRFEGTWSAP